jgi:hypothetical protein
MSRLWCVPDHHVRLCKETKARLQAGKKLLEAATKTLNEVRALSEIYEMPKVKPPKRKRPKSKRS